MSGHLIIVLVIMSYYAHPNQQVRLSNTATMKIATWNCNGLSLLKKELARELDYDIICIPETHKYSDDDRFMLYAAPTPKNDPWSGVSLMLSKRISKYITERSTVSKC